MSAPNHQPLSKDQEKALLAQAAANYDASQHVSVQKVQEELKVRLAEIEKTADVPSDLLHFRLS